MITGIDSFKEWFNWITYASKCAIYSKSCSLFSFKISHRCAECSWRNRNNADSFSAVANSHTGCVPDDKVL